MIYTGFFIKKQPSDRTIDSSVGSPRAPQLQSCFFRVVAIGLQKKQPFMLGTFTPFQLQLWSGGWRGLRTLEACRVPWLFFWRTRYIYNICICIISSLASLKAHSLAQDLPFKDVEAAYLGLWASRSSWSLYGFMGKQQTLDVQTAPVIPGEYRCERKP